MEVVLERIGHPAGVVADRGIAQVLVVAFASPSIWVSSRGEHVVVREPHVAADVPGVARVVDDAARDAAKTVGPLAQQPVDAVMAVSCHAAPRPVGPAPMISTSTRFTMPAPVSPTWCEIAWRPLAFSGEHQRLSQRARGGGPQLPAHDRRRAGAAVVVRDRHVGDTDLRRRKHPRDDQVGGERESGIAVTIGASTVERMRR